MSDAEMKPAAEFSRLVTRVEMPKGILFYILLGAISTARKLLTKSVHEGCPRCGPERCTDFTAIKAGTELGVDYTQDGFRFIALDNVPLRVIGWGVPEGQSKLAIREDGCEIHLPEPSPWAFVRVAQYTGTPLVLKAFAGDQMLMDTVSPEAENVLHTLSVKGENIDRLVLSGGGNEGLLFDVCVAPLDETPEPVEVAETGETLKTKEA